MICHRPKVSIVIPAYNAAGTIRRTLDALRRQTFQEFEVIVVDDASTDATTCIVETAVRQDSRIKLIRLPEKLGTFRARLAGISQSHGEYVTFVDSDDYIDAGAYARLIAVAQRTEADIVVFGVYREGPDGNRQIRIEFPTERMYESNLLEQFAQLKFGTGSMCNKIYRRFVLEEPRFAEVRKKLILNEDYLANIACFSRAKRVVTIPDILYYYVQSEGSQSSNVTGASAFVIILESFADALDIFSGANETILDAVSLLYKNQLRMDYCRIHQGKELIPYRLQLEAVARRIAEVRPEFIWEFLEYPSTPGNRAETGIETGDERGDAKVRPQTFGMTRDSLFMTPSLGAVSEIWQVRTREILESRLASACEDILGEPAKGSCSEYIARAVP